MAQQLIPLDSNPNQSWQATGSVNGGVVTLGIALGFNEVAQIWEMSIYDANGNLLVSSIPMVTGTNLLGQYQYLGIGSMYVLNASNVTSPDSPNQYDLGTDFVLAWTDNAEGLVGLAA